MTNKTSRIVRPSVAMRNLCHGGVNKWLYRHRRAILKLVKKDGRVRNWTPFMEQMAEDEVTRPSGKPLTTRAVSDAWASVLAALEREGQANVVGSQPAPTRRRGPSVEPPSRPGVNYRYDRPASPTTDDPSTGRERYHETSRQPEPPPQTAARAVEWDPERRETVDEQLARIDEEMRKADGFQPKPRNRGRII